METREERERERERELCCRRRERYVSEGERKVNKIIKRNYNIFVRTLSYLRAYYSMSQNFETFSSPHKGLFLVFGVPNAKYLAFGTPDENALMVIGKTHIFINHNSLSSKLWHKVMLFSVVLVLVYFLHQILSKCCIMLYLFLSKILSNVFCVICKKTFKLKGMFGIS